jgi:signal transduction histidine kinase/CheY-like chemotaxis protein
MFSMKSKNQRKLLIIDDCQEDRESYRRYLKQDPDHDYAIFEAETGEEGLERLHQDMIDVILLDYMLPDFDGIGFVEELKTHLSDLPPVVMLTGVGNEMIAAEAIKSGIRDYLVKGDTTPTNLQITLNRVIQQVQWQKQLKASEERFRASVETMLDCFGIYTSVRGEHHQIIDFKTDFINAAACQDNVLNKNFLIDPHNCHLSPFNLKTELFADCCYVVETGQFLCREISQSFNLPNGKSIVKIYDVRLSKLGDGFVAIWQDITERKQSETLLAQQRDKLLKANEALLRTTALLEKRNQELDEFAYIVSHDLKAPLRAVRNLSEWIEEDLEGKLDQDTQKQMDLLRQRVGHMERLINAVLQYSRAGRGAAPIETVSIKTLLKSIITSLEVPPKFTIEIPDILPQIQTQVVLLEQVFTNLITNGIKHHHRSDGIIKITAVNLGNSYEFAVSDNGPGIALQDQEKIFQIFQTLQPTESQESTGIGLAIVKKIVEQLGGTLRVESELGQGTTFYFTWNT